MMRLTGHTPDYLYINLHSVNKIITPQRNLAIDQGDDLGRLTINYYDTFASHIISSLFESALITAWTDNRTSFELYYICPIAYPREIRCPEDSGEPHLVSITSIQI